MDQKTKLRASAAPLKLTQNQRTQQLTITQPKTAVFQKSKNAERGPDLGQVFQFRVPILQNKRPPFGACDHRRI
jgi:hypothetical protein